MARLTTYEDMLNGIESNIEATENQMYQLHIDFASLMISGQRLERRLILQQLHMLEDNLELLKVRRMYALETLH